MLQEGSLLTSVLFIMLIKTGCCREGFSGRRQPADMTMPGMPDSEWVQSMLPIIVIFSPPWHPFAHTLANCEFSRLIVKQGYECWAITCVLQLRQELAAPWRIMRPS